MRDVFDRMAREIAGVSVAEQGVLPEGIHFLQKHIRRSELAARIREILG